MKPWRGAVLAGVLLLHAGAVAALRAPTPDTAPVLTPPVLEVSLMAAPEPAPVPAMTPTPITAPPPPDPAPPPPKPRPTTTTPRPKPVPRPKPAPQAAIIPQPPSPMVTAASQPAAAQPATTTPAAASAAPSAMAATPTPPVRAPAAITCRTPAYPAEARRRGQSGTVLLGLLVSVDGSVVDHRLERSSGVPALDQAALAALSQCRFKPGTVDGRPHTTWARLRYVWKLE